MTTSNSSKDGRSTDLEPELTRRAAMGALGLGGLGMLLGASSEPASAAVTSNDFSYTSIEPGTSVSDINNALSSPGTYVFQQGDHALEGTIEITADDVSIIVENDAIVRLSDTATPKRITDNGGNQDYGMLFYAKGRSGVSFVNRGILEANQSTLNDASDNSEPVDCIWAKNCDRLRILNFGGIFRDAGDGAFIIDSRFVQTWGFTGRDCFAPLVLEGLTDSRIHNTYGIDFATEESVQEVIDMNATCERCVVNGVYGENVVDGLFEANSCRDLTVKNVSQIGSTKPNNLVVLDDFEGGRFTDKNPLGDINNISLENIYGTSSDNCFYLASGARGKNARNWSVTGLNVRSTGARAVQIRSNKDNVFDGLKLEGKIRSDTSNAVAVTSAGSFDQGKLKNAQFDVSVSADVHGLALQNLRNSQVVARASDAGGAGVFIRTADGRVVENNNFVVDATNCDKGLQLADPSGSSVRYNRFTGVAKDNATVDIDIGNGNLVGNVFDVTYDTLAGRSNGTRHVYNGLGYNGGDPQSTGQWNGNGVEGVLVRDTTNNDTYLFNDGSFSKIAST